MLSASGYPMKMRGIIFILAAIPGWVSLFWWLNRFTPSNRFGAYELGSVAMPLPLLVKAAGRFAFVGTLIGLALLVFDFVQWMRRKSRS